MYPFLPSKKGEVPSSYSYPDRAADASKLFAMFFGLIRCHLEQKGSFLYVFEEYSPLSDINTMYLYGLTMGFLSLKH